MVQKVDLQENLENFSNEIKSGVSALLHLMEDSAKEKLLLPNGSSVFLQVSLFKVPEVEELVKRRIPLPHPVTNGKPEVCLIVMDRIKRNRIGRTTDEMIEETIEYYEGILKRQNVTGITNIMPLKQLLTEYNTYELQRKLVNRFDVFLCESGLLNRHSYLNGLKAKIFLAKNKYPVSVKMTKSKNKKDCIARRINAAISSAVFHIKPGADNYSIRIGNSLKPQQEIRENAEAAMKKLASVIPGGFQNIRAVNIKCEKSKPVPIYLSLSSGNDVPVPHVGPNAPLAKPVQGELSTQPGKKVIVFPTGDVIVKKIKGGRNVSDSKSDDEEFYTYASRNETEDVKVENFNHEEKRRPVKKKMKALRDDLDEDEMEEAIESVEQRYLSNLNAESSEEEENAVETPKQGKKRKLKQDLKVSKKIKKDVLVGSMLVKPSKMRKVKNVKLKEKSAKTAKDITVKKENVIMKSSSVKAHTNNSNKGLKTTKKIKKEGTSNKKVRKDKKDPAVKSKSVKRSTKNVTEPQPKTVKEKKKSKKREC